MEGNVVCSSQVSRFDRFSVDREEVTTVELHVNGREVILDDSVQTISDLLQFFRLQDRIVIVEHNREIVDKEHYPSKKLDQGDRVEIVHFVGGG